MGRVVRVLDSRPKGRGFQPHPRHCVVSLSKNINPSLVLVQSRKTCPFITERLLMGRKESNQTKTNMMYKQFPNRVFNVKKSRFCHIYVTLLLTVSIMFLKGL